MRTSKRACSAKLMIDRLAAASRPMLHRQLLLDLQPRLILADELPYLIGHVEKLQPLLLVQGHWEPPQAVNGYPPFVAHLQRRSSRVTLAQRLVFRPEAFQFGFQLFLVHGAPPVGICRRLTGRRSTVKR